jgi:hypothetical protein
LETQDSLRIKWKCVERCCARQLLICIIKYFSEKVLNIFH